MSVANNGIYTSIVLSCIMLMGSLGALCFMLNEENVTTGWALTFICTTNAITSVIMLSILVSLDKEGQPDTTVPSYTFTDDDLQPVVINKPINDMP